MTFSAFHQVSWLPGSPGYWRVVILRSITEGQPHYHGGPRHADQGQDTLLLQREAVPRHAVCCSGGDEEVQVMISGD